MYVCICKGINEASVVAAVESGCQRLRDLRTHLGVCDQCGKCAQHARGLMQQTLARAGEIRNAREQSL